jgi:trimethylamine--corrinoid protein Co-methyltransferase
LGDRSIGLPRPRLLTPEQLEQIYESAIRVLLEDGLRVRHAGALAAAEKAGLRVSEDRVFPDGGAISECVAEAKSAGSQRASNKTQGSEPFTLYTCQYPTHVHDLETDRVVPFTRDRLVEAAKLVDSLSVQGVIGGAPGCPSDVPIRLQPILQYRIQAQYCRQGREPIDPRWAETMPYVMEMAEALGRPLRSLPVYVVSPLTIGGESLECAVRFQGRLERLWTSNMSSVGATAPVRIAHAIALGVAEVIGSAIVLNAITGLPVDWAVHTVAFDLRGMAMSFGGPEYLLFRWACEEVNAFLHGGELGPPAGVMRTQAKLPGPQAAAEKTAGVVAGALLGSRHFDGAGTLSLDEVFSPEQLVTDCELRDHAERLVVGIDGECDPVACAAEAAAGLDGGFLGLDSTLDSYQRVYWLPKLFERRSLAGWREAGSPELRARAREIARALVASHEYELPQDLARELDRIYARAERELAA